MSVGDTETAAQRRARWPLAAGVAGVAAFVATVLWVQRAPIADNFVSRELQALGVRASYDLVQVGLRTQRIENVVIGDPARPDLSARWIEIDLGYGGLYPSVVAVRASGVRMRAKLTANGLSLGELDKFRDPKSTAPFAMPDIDMRLQDARVQLSSPWGQAGLKIDGKGGLKSGFRGKLAAVAPALQFSGCSANGVTAYTDIALDGEKPLIRGPVRMSSLNCPEQGVALKQIDSQLSLALAAALDRWTGDLRFENRGAQLVDYAVARTSGAIRFAGDAQRTSGDVYLSGQTVRARLGYGDAIEMAARYVMATGQKGAGLQATGTASARNVRSTERDPLLAFARASAGTPFAPLAGKLAGAVRDMAKGNGVSTRWTLNVGQQLSQLSLSDFRLTSASGAHVAMAPGAALSADLGTGAFTMLGGLSMSGGGLPTAALTLQKPQRDKGIAGQLFIEPYAAGGARIDADTIRFVAAPGGVTRFDTVLRLDGPLPDGQLRGLQLPLSGRYDEGSGRWAVNERCVSVRFTQLKYSSLALDATRTNLCPVGGAMVAGGPRGLFGGVRVPQLRLKGRLGQSAMLLDADEARYLLPDSRLDGRSVALRLGEGDQPVKLSAAQLDGRLDALGLGGAFSGGGGQIGAVPLILSDMVATWRFADGGLAVDGKLAVDDAAQPYRFTKMRSEDAHLTLRDGRIDANGTLAEARSGIKLADVRITHRLGDGSGDALLTVRDLQFGDALQPDRITPLALGVVANVQGRVNGEGRIAWTPDGVKSSGAFSTTNANLAAAFGPVEGLSGTIRFSDLLNMVTEPGQEVRVATINPGIPVTNGLIHYQLLPGNQVQIEGGEWPFAGGKLILKPARIDLSADKPRRMTLAVENVDAAVFLQQFAFENINATGVFDGTMPLVFDAQGGRVENGELIARPGGGGIAYVGELTKEDLGSWGNFAFQSLRDIRYRTLAIVLNGQLDGEMVTAIRFTGLSQGTGAKQNFLTRKIASLPIIFNVNIRAPFRQLLYSARSFYDPSLLIEANLPALMDAQNRAAGQATPPKPQTVQPSESEKQP
ncbi:MAG: YdbH domain-containing protein [Sphingobium sp.]|nr:YdbH domain-containing protein [Sphingobium sp.]